MNQVPGLEDCERHLQKPLQQPGYKGAGVAMTARQHFFIQSKVLWLPLHRYRLRRPEIGGSQPINIRNPYLGSSFVLAPTGIFPSRN